MRKGKILHKKEKSRKNIRAMYDKRELITTENGIDTAPLILAD